MSGSPGRPGARDHAQCQFFIDPTLASAAGPYYTLYPVEPTPSASSADSIKPDGKPAQPKSQNLDEWLAAIAAGASAGGNIVLVSHGNKMGLKLYIGDKGQDVHLEREAADAIRRNQAGNETDDNTAQILKMKPADWAKLKALIAKVQALGLNRVDARACNIGQDADSMSAMQQFFNCSTFCSPKILDSFGSINYGQFIKDPATFDKWVKDHPGAVVSGSAGDRFGFSQNLSKGVASEAAAESAKGVKAWPIRSAGRRQFHRQQPALLPRADRPQDIRLRGRAGFPRPAGRGHQGQRAVAQDRPQQRAPDTAVRA